MRKPVAQHARALILALARQLHLARDNQARRYWRGMVSDLSQREDELAARRCCRRAWTHRLAAGVLSRCFGMRGDRHKRDVSIGAEAADGGTPAGPLIEVLPQARRRSP